MSNQYQTQSPDAHARAREFVENLPKTAAPMVVLFGKKKIIGFFARKGVTLKAVSRFGVRFAVIPLLYVLAAFAVIALGVLALTREPLMAAAVFVFGLTAFVAVIVTIVAELKSVVRKLDRKATASATAVVATAASVPAHKLATVTVPAPKPVVAPAPAAMPRVGPTPPSAPKVQAKKRPQASQPSGRPGPQSSRP